MNMNQLPINSQELADKLNNGIQSRPAGQSPEQAAKAILPNLSEDEKAVLVAVAADTMAQNAQILRQSQNKYREG